MPYDGRLLSGVTVLMAVVEAGAMVRAAEILGMSPSGVGRAVSRLEARVGVKLLDRTTRSLRLTDEGRLFYEKIGPHLDAIEEAAVDAASAVALVRGRLRVNIDPFIAQVLITRNIPDFLAQHKDLTLELIRRDSVGDLVADGFDLALTLGNPTPTSLIARKLLVTRVLTVAAPAYLAAYGTPLHPRDIAKHEAVSFSDGGHRLPPAWRFQKGSQVFRVTPKTRFITSDGATLIESGLAGSGLMQVLEFGVQDLIEAGKLIELCPDYSAGSLTLYAMYPPRRYRAAKIEAFLNFVIQSLKMRNEG